MQPHASIEDQSRITTDTLITDIYKYLVSNPITALSAVVFSTGSLFIALHFYQIHYVPIFTFDSVMPVAGMAALLGVLFVFAILAIVVAPSLVYINLAEQHLLSVPLYKGKKDAPDQIQQDATFEDDSKNDDPDSQQVNSETVNHKKPNFVKEMSASFLSAFLAVAVYSLVLAFKIDWAVIVFFVSLVCCLAANIALDSVPRARSKMLENPKTWAFIIILFTYLTFLPFLITAFSQHLATTKLGFYVSGFFLLITVLLIHHGLYLSYRMPWKLRVIGLIMMSVALILMTNIFGNLPKMLASNLGYGMIENAELVITNDACLSMKTHINTVSCSVAKTENQRYRLRNIFIWSKLGETYLISDADNFESAKFVVEIPRDQVIGFSRVLSHDKKRNKTTDEDKVKMALPRPTLEAM